MRINADLSKRAVVVSDELPWVDSPLPGVQRRMLERDGDEVARATSLVHYAPDSSFDAHTPSSPNGCTLYLKKGHLPAAP